MTAHRILSGDGSDECYACGTHVANGWQDHGDIRAETSAAFDYIACRPGGWDHPPYCEVGPDGLPVVETCAAHPYSDCTIDAPGPWGPGRYPATDDLGIDYGGMTQAEYALARHHRLYPGPCGVVGWNGRACDAPAGHSGAHGTI